MFYYNIGNGNRAIIDRFDDWRRENVVVARNSSEVEQQQRRISFFGQTRGEEFSLSLLWRKGSFLSQMSEEKWSDATWWCPLNSYFRRLMREANRIDQFGVCVQWIVVHASVSRWCTKEKKKKHSELLCWYQWTESTVNCCTGNAYELNCVKQLKAHMNWIARMELH